MDEIKTKLFMIMKWVMKFVLKFDKIFFLFKKSMIELSFLRMYMHILKHYRK